MVTAFLAFLPFVSFLFQCCFDTSTAVVELVSDGAVTATNTRNKGPGSLINRTVAGAQAAGRFNKEVVEPGTRRAASSFAKGAKNFVKASVNPFEAKRQIENSKSGAFVNRRIQKAENAASATARGVGRAVEASNRAAGAARGGIARLAGQDPDAARAAAAAAASQAAAAARAAAVSEQRRAGVGGDGSVDRPYTSASAAAGWDDGGGDWSDAEGPLLTPSAQQRRARRLRGRAGGGARTGAIAGAVDALGAFGQRVLRLGVAPRPRTPPESPESP